MFFLPALFCVIIVSCNLLVAYDQNHNVPLQANISWNAPCNPYESLKPTVQLHYGRCIYIPEPYRPSVSMGIANKQTSKKQIAQKNIHQLNSAQKAAMHNFATQRILDISKSYQANFDGMYPTIYLSLQQFILNPTMQQADLEHACAHQMIEHLITTNQTHHGIITRYQQHPWVYKKDISKASQEEKIMVNYMLDCMVGAENNTTVELAQAALRAWIHAQGAQTQQEYELHIKKCNNYYSSMQHKKPNQSMYQQAKPVQKADIEHLAQNYAAIIENNRSATSLPTNSFGAQYAARIEKRARALVESKEQVRTNKLVHHTYEMSYDARGFLMANNMNYAVFDAVNVTNFQHCLTQEILDIIESSVDTVQRNGCQSIIAQLAYYNCNLAISAQQLNQLSHIQQAAAVTDLSHFFAVYGRSILDDALEAQAWIALGTGVYDGATKVLYKWHEFAKKLGHRDTRSQTVADLAHDCYQVGKFFYHILEQCNEFNPLAYLGDMTQDMHDATHRMFANHYHDEADPADYSSRMAQRQERNFQVLQHGLSSAVDAGTAVVHSMLAKTAKENISDITQFSLDTIIYGKITDAVMAISKIGASQCFTTSRSLQQLSQEILEDTMSFATSSSGELVAIAGTTGENISAALASATQILANNAGPVFKYAGQAKILSDKIEEITKPNKQAVEAFQKSIEPYLRTDKIINIERLKSIEGVEQIDKFKEYTNNFKNLEKLTPEEILYLNLCDWLEPQARAINEALKKKGGIDIIDRKTKKVLAHFEEYDIFHSFLGEMKPKFLNNVTSGGHLPLVELRSAVLETGEIKAIGNGFFDMTIKRGSNRKINSYFPIGKSAEQCIAIIEDGINNLKIIISDDMQTIMDGSIKFESYAKDVIQLHIKKGKVTFYPSK